MARTHCPALLETVSDQCTPIGRRIACRVVCVTWATLDQTVLRLCARRTMTRSLLAKDSEPFRFKSAQTQPLILH
ncbi:hypothetical protein F441_05077 [Phytophthora nicotianae CJ01A1]|uniref:Uncharacterized protein n=2 Tax=Phytophthora nicotianae TaxID=4792 RepID=W2JEQ4_PHYNI|nr:hypothetical protein L916_04886 [Phytophthora nicotianae]ETL98060.1 hypothetical protein L917_04786 [Phytophthora nicotianae]ETP21384.1 hypothetical protein F441_05077 [Phytophthora nicotianae CJ01A1]